jgi:DtxR family Mn-dependent transcriptional regulator
MEKLSAAMENYLKTIYSMCRDHTTTRVSDIAAHMKLSKASVSQATDFLSEKGLVQKFKYQGLRLTAEGYRQAALLSQKNVIIKRFLQEVLNVDPSVAEKDACDMEHCVSFESFQSICNYFESHDRM